MTRAEARTFNGRPLGIDRFIAKLESRLNRRLRHPKMDRPPQPKAAEVRRRSKAAKIKRAV